MTAAVSASLHMARPSAYLDLWVWIRLANAAQGRAREPVDEQALAAVRQASAAGVVFPLCSTHYIEIFRINDPRQRHDVARIMMEVSRGRTLRGGRDLLRHQFLVAMHESFGRPAFRPALPQVVGCGAGWAFTGVQGGLGLRDSDGRIVDPSSIPGGERLLRLANQFTEFRLLAGPRDEEIEDLRRHGYRPETTEEATRSRIAWEEALRDRLAAAPISRQELRVWALGREMAHEHLELFDGLLCEYRIDLHREIGYTEDRPRSGRAAMVAFADRVPSLRIAADLKVELFRSAKPWTVNAMHDIDALSAAVPYCHLVVPDSEMADLLARSKAGQRCGTQILSKLNRLPQALSGLTEQARQLNAPADGWELTLPGEAFCTDEAVLQTAALKAAG
ncbi:hypothetical protein ACGFX4_38395 [Kitasatospora sp. NPDC048365]|uniref:hypothetical protein n=1 Tax=Kitasatospora sp. NPDC048365 TaxID=3364050 RepID=UPI00371BB864